MLDIDGPLLVYLW